MTDFVVTYDKQRKLPSNLASQMSDTITGRFFSGLSCYSSSSVVMRSRPSCKSPLVSVYAQPDRVHRHSLRFFCSKTPGQGNVLIVRLFVAVLTLQPHLNFSCAPLACCLDALVSKVTHKDTDVSRLAKAICEDRRSAEDKYRECSLTRRFGVKTL